MRRSRAEVPKEEPFRYIRDPHVTACYSTDPQPCVACGRQGPTYLGVEFSDDEPGVETFRVCELCLSAGELQRLGRRVNMADRATLEAQLRERFPELPAPEREELARRRTAEIECRTPLPAIFQPFAWPAHCGEYCCFLQSRVSNADLDRLASDGDGKAFLLAHLVDAGEDASEWVEGGWAAGFSAGSWMRLYLWRCLECDRYQMRWDHD